MAHRADNRYFDNDTFMDRDLGVIFIFYLLSYVDKHFIVKAKDICLHIC